jgi:hypothetical protein
MDQFFGTALHAPEAVHTLIINGINHLLNVQASIIVYSIDTLLLHTDRTPQATFPPGDDT